MNLELERLVRAGGRDDDVADGVKPPAPALGCYRLLPQLLCPLLLRILRGRGDGRARESKREQRGQQASYKNESSHRAMTSHGECTTFGGYFFFAFFSPRASLMSSMIRRASFGAAALPSKAVTLPVARMTPVLRCVTL